MTEKIFIMLLRIFKNNVFIFVVCIILSALLLVNNSPHVSKWSSNICKSLFATTEFQHFRLSRLRHVNQTQCVLIVAQRMNFFKSNRKNKTKNKCRFLLGECAWPAAGRQDTLWSGIFLQQPYISTLLHVAIMRDKALSNEQLHVVRTVPITNHCVWRKTFLCTNIPAHSSLALPPHQEGRKMQAVGWTPLLKGQAAVTHIHVWDSGGIQTACLALWLPLID